MISPQGVIRAVKHGEVSGLEFLRPGGKVGDLIRAHDWSASSLGPPGTWPQPLRSVVELVLQSMFPMLVAWGPELRLIYNDAYAELIGSKHPKAVGAPLDQIWAEIWPDIGPLIDAAMAGEATFREDLPLIMNRNGFDEQTWFTFSYSPVRDETGRVAGIFCACVESTHKVLAERRAEQEPAGIAQLFQQAPGFVAVLRGPDGVIEFGNDALTALLGERVWKGRPIREAFPELQGQGFFELVSKAYATGERQFAYGMRAGLQGPGDPEPRELFLDVMYAPLTDEQGNVTGVFALSQDVTERMRAEAARRDADERLRLALAAGGMGTFTWRVAEDATDADERMMSMFGLPVDGDLSLRFAMAERIHPDDRERYARAVASACDPNGPGELHEDIRVVLPGVAPRWLSITGQVRFGGEPRRGLRMAGTAADVTDRKLVEEALRASERQFAEELANARALQAFSTKLIREQRPQALYGHMLDAAMQLMKSDAAMIFAFDGDEETLRLQASKNLPPDAAAYWSLVGPDSACACGLALRAKRRTLIEDVEANAELVGTPDLDHYRECGIRAIQATPLFSRAGRMVGMMSTHWREPTRPSNRQFRFYDVLARQAADLIERLKTEAQLRQSEEQLRLATEAADIGLWDVDVINDKLFWPPRVKAMFGISSGVPVSLADFYAGLHPADRDFVSAEYAAAADPAIRSIYDVEYRTIGKEDGVERWLAAKGRGVFDDDGRCVRMIGTAIDVTARKAAEARLRELNETLEQRVEAAIAERNVLADIVEGTDALVQVADLDYRFLAINKASADEFERIFGVRPAVGDNMLDILADQPDQQAAVKRIWSRALAGEEFTEIDEFGDPARDRRFYEMKFNILRDHDGRTTGAYQFVHDVTERLRSESRLRDAETALRHAQKMEAVGQLTGGVAHDFNNLLMAISGGLRLIEKPLDADRRERAMAGMRRAVERGASLTRQLLAFSRQGPLASQPVNLSAQIAGMREFIDRSLGGDVLLEMQFSPDLWPIEVDTGELELAVLNLCLNARDAMPAGGVIMIDARNRAAGAEGVAGEWVELCVADTGTGMSEEILGRAYEPFFTTKEIGKGSGLGLSQVYAFATNSGGVVSIESKPEMGTTVRLRFPRSLRSPAVAPADGELQSGAGAPLRRTGHVLLVEDDREVASLSQEMLINLGFEVTHAGSAEAALGALKNGREIDVVFSDVRMPGGMNGVDLAREIRRRNPRLPVVLTTGYAVGVSDAEADGFPVLAKPYQLEALSEILSRQLG
jgi:PAS domain S-box-containing protein